MKKKDDNKIKDSNEIIIDEAVRLYKEGKIKNYQDVENFIDNLVQPIFQKMLDTELDNLLEYSKYEHKKDSNNSRNGYCKTKKVPGWETKRESGTKKYKLNLGQWI